MKYVAPLRAQTGWKFYDWWGIVLPAFLIIWTTNGLTFNGVAVFDEKVLGELGVSVGVRSIGKAMGAINVLDASGGALGPFVTGVLYDATHDYQLGFGVIVALVGLAMLMLVMVRLPAKA